MVKYDRNLKKKINAFRIFKVWISVYISKIQKVALMDYFILSHWRGYRDCDWQNIITSAFMNTSYNIALLCNVCPFEICYFVTQNIKNIENEH